MPAGQLLAEVVEQFPVGEVLGRQRTVERAHARLEPGGEPFHTRLPIAELLQQSGARAVGKTGRPRRSLEPVRRIPVQNG